MHRFERILLLADGLGDRQTALDRAVSVAKAQEAALTIVCVVDDVHRSTATGGKLSADELQKIIETEASQQLEELAADARAAGLAASTRVLRGVALIEIVREVLREGHDLVIKTAERPGRLQRLFLGSLDQRLIRKCPAAVWIVNPEDRQPYRRIAAAVDLEQAPQTQELNRRILDSAAAIAQIEGREFHVVHAWTLFAESVLRRQIPQLDVDEMAREMEDASRKRLEHVVQPHAAGGVAPQLHLHRGAADEVIPEFVESQGVDLLVMGTLCRTGIPGFFIGNTAEKVLNQVRCSVLTVKPAGFVSPIELNDE